MVSEESRKTLNQSYMIELKDLNSMNTGYLTNIKESNRVSLLSTILGCISLSAGQRNSW